MGLKILHIVPHLGGGIGTAILPWIKMDDINSHVVLCLDDTYVKPDYSKIYNNMHKDHPAIKRWVECSDIVVIHFWNHPRLFELLTNFSFPPCRLCIWSHISGISSPYVISEKAIKFSDRFVFTSPISYNLESIKTLPENLFLKLSDIWAVGDMNLFFRDDRTVHDDFTIGYLGTLDFSKLHPNFVSMCKKVNIPNVKFLVVGRGYDKETLEQQVRDLDMQDKFEIVGFVDDLTPFLQRMDVFGYPLNPTHFGTCELVIGEAIASGLIPVVLKNQTEEYIFSHMKEPKLVAETEEEYVNILMYLYNNIDKFSEIKNILKNEVLSLYRSGNTLRDWNKLFSQVMLSHKHNRTWDTGKHYSGSEIFIESLGEHAWPFILDDASEIKQVFKSNLQWKSKTKGSIFHYLTVFPNDPLLQKWATYV